MAKTRLNELCTMVGLDDVDEALRTIGDYERRIEAVNADMEAKLNRIREEAAQLAQPLITARKGLETQIGLYAKAHVREFDKVRTKVLNFGEFGFRQSTSVKCPSSPDSVAEVVARMRERDMMDCIKAVPDAIDRAKLRQYDAEAVRAVGCELVTKDTFFCAAKREDIPEVE